MSDLACRACGKDPAEGYATVGQRRYCHGDFTVGRTCYEQEQAHLTCLKDPCQRCVDRLIDEAREQYREALEALAREWAHRYEQPAIEGEP